MVRAVPPVLDPVARDMGEHAGSGSAEDGVRVPAGLGARPAGRRGGVVQDPDSWLRAALHVRPHLNGQRAGQGFAGASLRPHGAGGHSVEFRDAGAGLRGVESDVNVGIVGNGENKFSMIGRARAYNAIRTVLQATRATTVVSGHSPLGGVDLWAEEIGQALGLALNIKAPKDLSWGGEYGYKARNLDIARSSDLVVVVAA